MKKIFLIASLLTICTPALAQTYTVERVIDGNTIKLTNGETVRLIGIDIPESRINDKAKRDAERTGQDLETITKMGQEATEFVESLFPGKQKIFLEFDVQKRDKYGRLLAYVKYNVGGKKYWDGPLSSKMPEYYEVKYKMKVLEPGKYYNFLNASIIKAGYAQPMTTPPNVKYAGLFQELYEEVREQKMGLWKDAKINVKLPDYDVLSKECKNDNCCMASIKAMKKRGGLLVSEDASFNDGCPEGYKIKKMLCITSFEWCEPE